MTRMCFELLYLQIKDGSKRDKSGSREIKVREAGEQDGEVGGSETPVPLPRSLFVLHFSFS